MTPTAAPDGTYYDRELETTPWEQVQQATFEKAQRQIERVYERSVVYRERFDEAGVKPADVRVPEDLAQLPFFDKEVERESQDRFPPFGGHLAVDPVDVVRVHASSGTTGRPTFFALTARDLDTWNRIMARSFYTMGMRDDDVYALLGNLSMFVGGIPALTATESLGATALPIGATAGTQRTLELMRDLGTTLLGATPSFAVYLAELVEQLLGIPARELGLRRMMVGGEPGGQIPAVREQIEEAWGCEIRDVMGIGEFAGAMWAESDDRDGMHFCGQAEIHLELIDPDTAEPIPFEDGATGELVYTAVEREAVPMIRFRSHDHVLVRTREVPSGRTAPRVTTLGRTDDMLIVRGINVFPSAVRDVVASFAPRTTGHIQIVLDNPGPIVSPPVPVEIEVADDLGSDERETLADQIADRVRQQLNFRAEVRFIPAGSLPRTSLKTDYFKRLWEGDGEGSN